MLYHTNRVNLNEKITDQNNEKNKTVFENSFFALKKIKTEKKLKQQELLPKIKTFYE